MGRMYTQSQANAIKKYREKFVNIQIQVLPAKRDEYKEKAKLSGKSLTQYIVDLIENDIKST